MHQEEAEILIVGAGRLALSLLRTFTDRIAGVVVRNPERIEYLRSQFPLVPIYAALDQAERRSYNAIWIATTDSAIGTVTEEIARNVEELTGLIILHSSGATPLSILDPLERRGAIIIALHPNVSLNGERPISRNLVWGISTNDESAVNWVELMLAHLNPEVVTVDEKKRLLYHAAASIAGNFSVTIFEMAVEIYRRAGIPAPQATAAVHRFLIDSADRTEEFGVGALTGPIARGDWKVVEQQLKGIEESAPEYASSFLELVKVTARMAGGEMPGNIEASEGEDRS